MSTELLRLDENQLIELVKFVLKIKQNNINPETLVVQELVLSGENQWTLSADPEILSFLFYDQNSMQELKRLVERILKVL